MTISLALENKGFSDFCPVDFGYENCKPEHNYGPNIRNYYLIHYVCSGQGIFKNPNGTYCVGKGQAFLIRPGEICRYTADFNNPWNYIWIGFTGNMSECFDVLPDVFEADGFIFEEMKTAFEESMPEEFLTGMLFRLYCSIFEKNAKTDYSNKVIGYINANYMKDISIEEIANSLNINRKYLSRLFKQKQGITMQEYLIKKRMHEAKKLLKKGYNVEETAYMVGYCDSFAFSKAFKKVYEKSPKYFKSEIL